MGKSRGQGATEYLVILGAVLLITLVIVSLLGWFPSLGGSTKETQSKSYWASATPFTITAVKVSNSTLTFTISNRLTERLYLTSVEVQDGFGNFGTIMTPNQIINAGEETILTGLPAVITNSTLNPCYSTGATKAGSPFEFKAVALIYSQGLITGNREQGSQALVGKCS
ncbi:MAG: hypothetical protein WC408_01110 [Candidatus Micrarchaeia archaeon]|jgi:hypothetical protein